MNDIDHMTEDQLRAELHNLGQKMGKGEGTAADADRIGRIQHALSKISRAKQGGYRLPEGPMMGMSEKFWEKFFGL